MPVLGPVWDFILPILRAVYDYVPNTLKNRLATRFENGAQPVLAAGFPTVQSGRRNGLGPVLKTGRGPFWDPSWILVCARSQGRFRIMCEVYG
jgi:hypothetical protein